MSYREILQEIHQVQREIVPPDANRERSHLEYRQKQHLKWQLIHAYVRVKPFRDNPRQPRSRQWQDAMNQVRELHEQEVIDWLWQQSDIARNKEKGIQDVRPPARGTCHEGLLGFLRMREHKSLVVLQWEEGAQEHGCWRVDSNFHARTKEILDRVRKKDEDDDESWRLDPWLRS